MRLVALILLLVMVALTGISAEPLSIGIGLSTSEGSGRVGPAAPASFLVLEAGGFISLESAGKLQCESC